MTNEQAQELRLFVADEARKYYTQMLIERKLRTKKYIEKFN